MTIVTIHKAKTELSKLIALAEKGEDVIIARGNIPVAKLTPLHPAPQKSRGIGAWKDFAPPIPDGAFFDPLPEEEQAAWDGKFGFDP